MKVKILGGAGAVGVGVARDLLRNAQVEHVVLADRGEEAANSALASLADRRVSWQKFDAADLQSLRSVMDSRYVIANCIGPHYLHCRKIAEAAIEAGANCCDICDDYDAAEAMLELDEKARSANVTVVTCLGTSPGVTNMLAKRGSDYLDETEEIHTYWAVGGADPTGPSEIYHLAHICSDTVPQFLNGKWERVPALSGTVTVEFPKPVGDLAVSYVGHSEPVTLPRFIRGVKTVTNRGGLFPPHLNDLLRIIRDIGLFADFPLSVRGAELSPRDYTVAHIRELMEKFPDALGLARSEPVSVFRVEVRGKRQDAPCEVIYSGTNEVVTTTARSLSIGAQLLARKKIEQKGVFAPEACMGPREFFGKLADGGGITLTEEIRAKSVLIR